jgi:puromycin-sensitive aminopeptidase
MSAIRYRIPKHVLPFSYHITLHASPKRTRFQGSLVCEAKVVVPTSVIELNARALSVTEACVHVGKVKHFAQVKKHADRETVTLVLKKPLKKGTVKITLLFAGALSPGMHGLYMAKDGPEKAVVSQCEAADARAIFPCFDEPDVKATLQWTVVTDPGFMVITNGVLEKIGKSAKHPGKQVFMFKKTKLLSTYLAAVTIGKLESSPVMKVGRVPCRVWSGLGKSQQAVFAQEVTGFVLPWYESYFGQKYAYGKLDQVAVPGFDAGAMENAGAIFYRQNLLLMDARTTGFQSQKRIAEVIAHEIAHQWFGNLVTMCWWDDLWLNEAFATWIAYKVCDVWKPDWHIWDDYQESQEQAMAADSLVNTHPIYTPVHSPAEATELFDVITYEKGCAVLRMVESYLGEDTFRKGIRAYQKKYQNSNAKGEDLWNQLALASGEPVGSMMQSWLMQSGFPLLTLTLGERAGRTVLHVHQRRFFADAEHMQQEHGQTWDIPLVIRYDMGNGARVLRVLASGPETVVPLPEIGHPQWVWLNGGGTGFFRTHYEEEALHALLEHGLGALTVSERMQLVYDQWALVRAGLSDVEEFMDMWKAFKDEQHPMVLRALGGRLATLERYVVDDAHRELLRARVCAWLKPQWQALGWDAELDESHERSMRRAVVLDVLGHVGRDTSLLREVLAKCEEEREDPASLSADSASVTVALASMQGDVHAVDACVKTFQQRKNARMAPDVCGRYVQALGCFENTSAVNKVLGMCLDGTVPQEQVRVVLGALLSKRASSMHAWKFLKKHWEALAPRVGSMGMARLVEGLGALDSEKASEVENFFTQNPVPEAVRALQKALESMRVRHAMVLRERARLCEWLERSEEEIAVYGTVAR